MQLYKLQAFVDLEFFIGLKPVEEIVKGRTPHEIYRINWILMDNLGECHSDDYLKAVKALLEGKSRAKVMAMGVSESFVRKSSDMYFFKRRMYYGQDKHI